MKETCLIAHYVINLRSKVKSKICMISPKQLYIGASFQILEGSCFFRLFVDSLQD